MVLGGGRMTALRRIIAGTIVLLLGAIALPDAASAHARYASSIPGTSEVVQASPARVEITFTEEIQKISGSYGMTVTDRGNDIVSSGPAVIDEQDRHHMSVPLAPDLPPGRYVVDWNNVSDADGDAIAGAFAFYVGVQPTAADVAADRALAEIGAPEVTPGGTDTASAGSAATAPPASTAPATVPASASAAPTAASASDGSSDVGNTGLLVGLGIAAAVIVVAGGGFLLFRSSRRA